MTTLRKTLAEHLMRQAGLVPDFKGLTVAGQERWLGHAAEVEAVVLAWVGARLAGAQEVVAETAWRAAADFGEASDEGPRGYVFDYQAEWVIAALRDALGVPVAPAGGEVAPGAAGDEIGPEIGAEGCAACPFVGCDGCEAEVARRANGEAK